MLSKEDKKRLVNIAWEQVEIFIKDWLKTPYQYSTERDIQADIANRIKRAYKGREKRTFFAKYRDPWVSKPYDEKGQNINRVCCEAPLYYKNGETPCRPDIVIFNDLKDPEHPPEQDEKGHKRKNRNCPTLWICEIKYRLDSDKKVINDRYKKWDWDKPRSLHKRRDGAGYGCWLYVHRMRPESYNELKDKGYEKKKGYMAKSITRDGKCMAYIVTLPPFKRKKQKR